ncbi:MAG TPA: hypothetical protein VGI55_16475, partial [Solirubrobacteraceae bacterium]
MFTKLIIAATVVATLAVPAASMASVSVDNSGAGTVGKGDVQLALGWNNGDFDKGASNVTFTEATSRAVHQVLRCNNTDFVSDSTQMITRPVNASPILNANGKQITGWNLTGVGTGGTNKTLPGGTSQFSDYV